MTTIQTTMQQDLGSLAADLVTAGNHEGAALVTAAVNAMAAPQQPVAASSHISESDEEPDFWPIAKLTVLDGKISDATFYAPALPDGQHDVFPAPTHLDEHTAAWFGVVKVLDEVAPGWLCGCGNGIDQATTAIRNLAATAQPTTVQAKALTDEQQAARFCEAMRKAFHCREMDDDQIIAEKGAMYQGWLLASQPSAQPIAKQEPEWINDPHDIEQGMMRNPKYKPQLSAPADVAAVREPWIPYLSDRADGVRGRYAIARMHPDGYREVWNLVYHKWAACSDRVLTLDEANKLLATMQFSALQLGHVEVPFTTGHCKDRKLPGGCPHHNVHCGYPACDRRAAPTAQPQADGVVK